MFLMTLMQPSSRISSTLQVRHTTLLVFCNLLGYFAVTDLSDGKIVSFVAPPDPDQQASLDFRHILNRTTCLSWSDSHQALLTGMSGGNVLIWVGGGLTDTWKCNCNFNLASYPVL
mgnify:CR=1 FL=1